MKIYRVELSNFQDNSCGFVFFRTKREAHRAATAWSVRDGGDNASAEITEIEIKPTKDGILRALERYASHPDNG